MIISEQKLSDLVVQAYLKGVEEGRRQNMRSKVMAHQWARLHAGITKPARERAKAKIKNKKVK